MSYPEAIQFLYQLQFFGMNLGLENPRRLAAMSGNPQDRLRFIHVAGTNGKGSTCAMLESIYRAAGWRVGLFTSPHLVSFAERIQVNRELISRDDVVRLTQAMQALMTQGSFPDGPPTFFEVVTVMALRYFAEMRCDLVIWETGLGGRLDATNIVTPLVSVITNIQLDHQKWLGNTTAEIAREKAGIIKPGIPIITAANESEALTVIAEVAREQNAPLTLVNPEASAVPDCAIGLAGAHQRINAALASAVVRALRGKLPVPETAIENGLKNVQWAGRLQSVERPGGQKVLLDGAHNPAGAKTLAAELMMLTQSAAAEKPGLPALILGTMRDKDYAGICRILAPLASRIYLAPIGTDRTADPALLAEYCRQANPSAEVIPCQTLAHAFALSQHEDFVVVTGSLHFIGEALELLQWAPPSTERSLNDYHSPALQAITFDIGGTLIQPWPSVGHIYAQVAARHGFDLPPETLNRQFVAAWQAKKNFSHTQADWSSLVDQTFAGLVAPPPSQTFFPSLYQAFTAPSAWRLFDDVLPCLEELRRRGLKLGVISNWDERLRPLLRELTLDHWFDSIVISVEVGCPKPNPAIFRQAARELRVDPRHILHIGDSQAEDFAAARAAGFQSRLLHRRRPPRPGEQLASLSELSPLL